MLCQPSDEQLRFHNQTTNLITSFLRKCGLPANLVNNASFISVLRHLNPLVMIPSADVVVSQINALQCRSSTNVFFSE